MIDTLSFRFAQHVDLPAIIRLLADDELGRQRERIETPLPETYYAAFERIADSPDIELIVAEIDGNLIGTLQLVFIPSLSFQGSLRVQVESVRVDEAFRNQGIGKRMMEWALEHARERGAQRAQLTSHQSRTAAHRFYERLGFKGTHLGMKRSLK